jgi:hypothetical protein
MDPERRHPILLAALAAAHTEIVDETVRVFDMMLSATDGNARDQVAKRQLDALHANLDRLVLLDDILDVVLDPDLDDTEVGGAVRGLGPARLANAARSPEQRPPRDGGHLELMKARFSHVRSFAPQIRDALTFAASVAPSEILEAVRLLQRMNVEGRRHVPDDAPLEFISSRWRPYLDAARKEGNEKLFKHVCPQRKESDVEGSFCDLCCASDGGRSSGFAVQAGSPNRRDVMSVKAGVGSDHGNGSLSAGQVCDEKTNMVEPLLTHRKTVTASQPGLVHISGRASRDWVWCSQRAACVSLWWCSVLRWRELVVGAGMEEENLCLDTVGRFGAGVAGSLAARGRTLGGRNRSGQSTARRRGGPARSSAEGPVMGLERRGRAGQLTRTPTRMLGRS